MANPLSPTPAHISATWPLVFVVGTLRQMSGTTRSKLTACNVSYYMELKSRTKIMLLKPTGKI